MKRHALFVGVDSYSDPTIKNLDFPAEDATELSGVFKLLLKFDRVEKLVNPAHAPEVVDAVKYMTHGLSDGDLFFFFFAGHGFRVKENHVLVCAKDEFTELEDEYAGLPVGLLKKRMRGPWNRIIVLDACQNDIRANRGAGVGVAQRDLELIHAIEDNSPESGFQIVITACSEGQTALEVADLKHGLFTSAMLDSVTEFADARRCIDLEALRHDLGGRMGRLIEKYRLSGRQEPMFTMPANAADIILLDGDAAPATLPCPVCGRKNKAEDTFKCRECGKDGLCLGHRRAGMSICEDCAEKYAKAKAWLENSLLAGGRIDMKLCGRCEECLDGEHGEDMRRGVLEICQMFSLDEKSFDAGSAARVAPGILKAICSPLSEIDNLKNEMEELKASSARHSCQTAMVHDDTHPELRRPLTPDEKTRIKTVLNAITPKWREMPDISQPIGKLGAACSATDALACIREIESAIRCFFEGENAGKRQLTRLPAFFDVLPSHRPIASQSFRTEIDNAVESLASTSMVYCANIGL